MKKILFIAGGSGSGKTFVSQKIKEKFQKVEVISLDSFYIDKVFTDFSELELFESLDVPLFRKVIEGIIQGKTVELPIYSYKKHSRLQETLSFSASDVQLLIFEGLYAIELFEKVKDVVSIDVSTLFMDVPLELMLKRRLKRDVLRTGQTKQEIKEQFETFVAPAFEKYISLQKEKAELVFENLDSDFQKAFDLII